MPTDNITTYQDSILRFQQMQSSDGWCGQETLQSGSYLQFMMNEAVNVSGDTAPWCLCRPLMSSGWGPMPTITALYVTVLV